MTKYIDSDLIDLKLIDSTLISNIKKKNEGRYRNVVQKKLKEFIKLSLISILLTQSKNHVKPVIELINKFNIKNKNPIKIKVKRKLVSIIIKYN